ncbi:hypothetical protein ZWY2020_022133 [Hordeum vulgare]|nr:hypothetical protein ZWY2020_022133 [Hordeum vulgare]
MQRATAPTCIAAHLRHPQAVLPPTVALLQRICPAARRRAAAGSLLLRQPQSLFLLVGLAAPAANPGRRSPPRRRSPLRLIFPGGETTTRTCFCRPTAT